MFKLINRVTALAPLCLVILVAGCSATYQNHGFVPTDSDLAELIEGVDSRATVDDIIGPPSSAGLNEGGDYFYVRSRVRTFGMFRPEVIERQILAISFDETDTIRNIERFSLEDGNAIALSRRVTDSSVEDNTFWQQMIRNIGNFGPAAL